MATIHFKQAPVHTSGELPQKGSLAKSFSLVAQDLSEKHLSDFAKKKKLLNIFPSLDTGVCSKSIHTFYEKFKKVQGAVLLNISYDLPFAAKRFCQAEALENVMTLSCFRSSFARDYGVLLVDGPLKGLTARSVLVIGEDDKILYTQLVSEITEEPDYDSALAFLKKS